MSAKTRATRRSSNEEDLAHAPGLEVVAEGVETAGQLARLWKIGRDMTQGIYFARPLPSEEIPPLIDDKHRFRLG